MVLMKTNSITMLGPNRTGFRSSRFSVSPLGYGDQCQDAVCDDSPPIQSKSTLLQRSRSWRAEKTVTDRAQPWELKSYIFRPLDFRAWEFFRLTGRI